MTDTAALRAAAEAAVAGGKWIADRPGMRFVADENDVYRALASPDRILALCEENDELRAALSGVAAKLEGLSILAEASGIRYDARVLREAMEQARAALEGKP